uniref:Endonuclease/exonuclease/phosphatase domain-containing protein n=1 Tax=Tetranychus urticae TaxID=32264 RepID=T1JR73_TETUR
MCGKLDNQAKRSPTKRAAWRYDIINQILTCFKRMDFQGTIQTFVNNRGDFLTTVWTSFLQSCGCKRGKDARDKEWDAVDAIVLAGDFNLKNVYYGKSVDRNYDPKEPKNKIQILLCYLLLFTNLVPNERQDKNRGYEIDYLCTSKNFKYLYTVEIAKPTNVAHQSDHEPYGAVYSLDGSIDPCTFAIDNKDDTWEDFKSHLHHLLGLNMKRNIVFDTVANETVAVVMKHIRYKIDTSSVIFKILDRRSMVKFLYYDYDKGKSAKNVSRYREIEASENGVTYLDGQEGMCPERMRDLEACPRVGEEGVGDDPRDEHERPHPYLLQLRGYMSLREEALPGDLAQLPHIRDARASQERIRQDSEVRALRKEVGLDHGGD